jgi:DNA polymerase-3 subunit gamma/tau
VIKSQGCTKEAVAEAPEPTPDPIIEPIPEPVTEPASMVEDVEISVGSCVSQCDEVSVKEFDGSDVLKEPMIAKAAELFEATKITVQSKV